MYSLEVCIDKRGGYVNAFKILKDKGWTQQGWTLRDPSGALEIEFNDIAEIDAKTGIVSSYIKSKFKHFAESEVKEQPAVA